MQNVCGREWVCVPYGKLNDARCSGYTSRCRGLLGSQSKRCWLEMCSERETGLTGGAIAARSAAHGTAVAIPTLASSSYNCRSRACKPHATCCPGCGSGRRHPAAPPTTMRAERGAGGEVGSLKATVAPPATEQDQEVMRPPSEIKWAEVRKCSCFWRCAT